LSPALEEGWEEAAGSKGGVEAEAAAAGEEADAEAERRRREERRRHFCQRA